MRSLLIILLALGLAAQLPACSGDLSQPAPAAMSLRAAPAAESEFEISTVPSTTDASRKTGSSGYSRNKSTIEPKFFREDPIFPDEVLEPLFMVVEASDDCVRPRHLLRKFTRRYVADNYPVMDAAMNGRLQAEYARDPSLDLGQTIPEEYLNPLMWSITMHCHELLDWLVDHDILDGDWNARLLHPGSTALMAEALRVDNSYALTVLLANGHDPNTIDDHSSPMLDYALSAEAVEVLIAGGAEPNPEGGMTPLDVAARSGRAEVVEALYSLTDYPSTAIYQVIKEARARTYWRQPIESLIGVLQTLKRLGADIDYPRFEEVPGVPKSANSPIDFARQISGELDPAVIAFLEDWAAE